MPQFDFATFPSQLFWLLLFLVILCVGSYGMYLPRLRSLLNERHKVTAGRMKEAEGIYAKERALQEKLDANLEAAKKKALGIRHQTQQGLQEEYENKKKAVDDSLSRDFDVKKAAFQKSLAQETQDSQNQVALLSKLVIEKIHGGYGTLSLKKPYS